MKRLPLSARTALAVCATALLGLMAAPAARSAASAAPTPAPARCLSDCTPRIGIVSAFGAEADILLARLRHPKTWTITGKRFTTGELEGHRVVVVLSGVSIVNATLTTQQLLDQGCIDARDSVARECSSVQLVGSRRVQGKQLAFEPVRKRGRSVSQYLEAFSSKVHQNSIHPIQRGARHQSDVEITHGCGVWRIQPACCVQAGDEYFY